MVECLTASEPMPNDGQHQRGLTMTNGPQPSNQATRLRRGSGPAPVYALVVHNAPRRERTFVALAIARTVERSRFSNEVGVDESAYARENRMDPAQTQWALTTAATPETQTVIVVGILLARHAKMPIYPADKMIEGEERGRGQGWYRFP
jgi:hypothetical protein